MRQDDHLGRLGDEMLGRLGGSLQGGRAARGSEGTQRTCICNSSEEVNSCKRVGTTRDCA